MEDNKHLAVMNWMAQNADIHDLFENFSTDEDGATVISTITGENAVKSFLDGSSLKQYDFAVVQFRTVNQDTPNVTENALTMFDVESVMEWIREQNRLRNYPEFPNGCAIQRVEVLNNMPAVTGGVKAAKFMFSCRITYLQRGE